MAHTFHSVAPNVSWTLPTLERFPLSSMVPVLPAGCILNFVDIQLPDAALLGIFSSPTQHCWEYSAPRRSTAGNIQLPDAALLIQLPDTALLGNIQPPDATQHCWGIFSSPTHHCRGIFSSPTVHHCGGQSWVLPKIVSGLSSDHTLPAIDFSVIWSTYIVKAL